MADKNSEPSASLSEVKAAAEELLVRAASPEVLGTELFPYGLTRLEVFVKAGDITVSLEMAGPEVGHSHGDEEEEWDLDDEDDFFDDEDTP